MCSTVGHVESREGLPSENGSKCACESMLFAIDRKLCEIDLRLGCGAAKAGTYIHMYGFKDGSTDYTGGCIATRMWQEHLCCTPAPLIANVAKCISATVSNMAHRAWGLPQAY